MKTTKLHQMLGGSGGNFDRLANSALGQKLLAAANRQDQKRQLAGIDPRLSAPHVEVVRQKLAAASRAELFANDEPAVSSFDAAMLAVRTAQQNERDQGLRRLAIHLHKLWEKDRSGLLTVGQLARLRAHYAGEYPKSGVPAFFDEELPRAGFHQLPVRRLQALARQVRTQGDYDAIVEEHGLGGADRQSVMARAYLRALVAASVSREPRIAVTPPGISEETMHELKEKEEKGEIENAYAVAWSIAEDKKGRKAGDASDAGERSWHPDVNEEKGEDAVDADKAMKMQDTFGSEGKPRRADKPTEPEFKPTINQSQGPQRDLPEEDAELRAARRSRAQVETDEPEDAELGEQVETLVEKHKQENMPAERREQARKAQAGCVSCGKPVSESGGLCPACQEVQKMDPMASRASRRVSRGRIEDVLLDGKAIQVRGYRLTVASRQGRDQIELTANGEPPMAWPMRKLTAAVEYFARTIEAQVEEVSDEQIEQLLQEAGQAGDQKMVEICRWALNGDEQARAQCADVIEEARAMQGRRAQSLEAPSVNEQQPDAVKPPAAKHPLGEGDSSGEDVTSLEADGIEQQHPAQDQAGTSEPSDDMSEGGAIPDPGRIPVEHDPGKNSGTSFPDTDLGPEHSAEEPAVFEPQVSPGRSARVNRTALRGALRGTVKHVAETDETDESEDGDKKAPFDAL